MHPLLLTLAIPIIIGIIVRKIRKQKLSDFFTPKTQLVFTKLSTLLNIRFGKKNAEKIEEGIIVTLLHVLSEQCKVAEDALLEDN